MVRVEQLDSSHSNPAPARYPAIAPAIQLLPAILPAIQLLPVIQPLPAILPAIALSGFHLLFPLDCACGRGARIGGRLIRGRLAGEGKFVREGRGSASRCRGRCRQGGLWVLAAKGNVNGVE